MKPEEIRKVAAWSFHPDNHSFPKGGKVVKKGGDYWIEGLVRVTPQSVEIYRRVKQVK